uniref:DUF4349 domain-containing protein n=1 Tax=Polaribacter sp. TaxID=1920175 RepID=UPI004047D4D1
MKNFKLMLLAFVLFVACTEKSQELGIENEMDYDVSITSRSLASVGSQKLRIDDSRNRDIMDQRKLIKTGNVSFKVDNLEITYNRINLLVKKAKGYISSDNSYNNENKISKSLSVRIPSDQFDLFMEELSKGVEEFDTKNITISDVTAQFIDAETRLKTKKALEQKYLDILKMAKSVTEVLNVERELGKIREEIESTEGRLKYLQSQVSFSSLSINFYTEVASSGTSFVDQLKAAFSKGLNNIKAFFMLSISYWPFFLIFIALLWYFKRKKTINT